MTAERTADYVDVTADCIECVAGESNRGILLYAIMHTIECYRGFCCVLILSFSFVRVICTSYVSQTETALYVFLKL